MSREKSPLTGEEVSALMSELSDSRASESPLVDDGDVRPFSLGQESFRPTARLAGLERMGERIARRLRTVIEPFTRAKAQVVAEPLQTLRFEDWLAELPPFTSLSLYRLRPLKNGMLVAVEPDFVASMVDCCYGGSGNTRPKTKEFTPTEEQLLGRLTDGLVEKLVEVWAEVVPLVAVFASREVNTAYASLVRGDEAVVVQRFSVTPGQGRATVIACVYPLAALRPYEEQLSAKVHADAGPADTEWRARLAQALEAVRLPVRSVLARPELSVSQLMALKPGDVIPINLPPKVPLLVQNKRLATGTIGEREGRAALMIEQVERTIK